MSSTNALSALAVKLEPAVINQLRKHNRHPFVTNAQESIARKRGNNGTGELENNYAVNMAMLALAARSGQLPGAGKVFLKVHMALNPFDALHTCLDYYAVYLSMKIFFETLKGKNILQLACNFGPFLHFLKEVEGANVFGIDLSKPAAAYAQEHGIYVLPASATALPFRNDAFDIVVSRNFLCPHYAAMITDGDPNPFIYSVISEVNRVLRPQGMFFSQSEAIQTKEPSLAMIDVYNAKAKAEIPGADEIQVFSKR